MLEFEALAVLALALPLGWVYWQWFRVRGVTGWLRGVLLLLLVVALAGRRVDGVLFQMNQQSLSNNL